VLSNCVTSFRNAAQNSLSNGGVTSPTKGIMLQNESDEKSRRGALIRFLVGNTHTHTRTHTHTHMQVQIRCPLGWTHKLN
jgi:hypothetical protein